MRSILRGVTWKGFAMELLSISFYAAAAFVMLQYGMPNLTAIGVMVLVIIGSHVKSRGNGR